jgi:hypothetical protein
MQLSDIIQRLTIGVMRDDLATSYKDFINEALVEIQRRRSWQCMQQIDYFNILNGQSSCSLNTNADGNATRFKELTAHETPVHLRAQDLVLTPCDVWTMEKVLRRQSRLISNSILYSVYSHPNTTRRVSVPVFINWVAGQPTLNVLFAADSDLPFHVSYYGYLPDLVDDDPDGNNVLSNEFTEHYPEMVVAKAKSIAFAAVNDPAAADFEALFEKKFTEAVAKDAYQRLAGLQLRM